MNGVLKCRQAGKHGTSSPTGAAAVDPLAHTGAGLGRGQPLLSAFRSLDTGSCFCSEQLGDSFSPTAAHVPAPLPKLPCHFFIARSFYLAALHPALKTGPPWQLCKYNQQIELSASRSKQQKTAALAPKNGCQASSLPGEIETVNVSRMTLAATQQTPAHRKI